MDAHPQLPSAEALERLLEPHWESPSRRYIPGWGWCRQCERYEYMQREDRVDSFFPQITHFCDGILVVWPERLWSV